MVPILDAVLPRKIGAAPIGGRTSSASRGVGAVVLAWACMYSAAFADESRNALSTAKAHLAKGRYEEALEAFQRAADGKADPVAVAIGRSRAHEAVGEWDDAEKRIDDAIAQHPNAPQLLARRAELHFLRGRYTEAEQTAERALQADRDQPLARLVRADVYAETGRLREANEGYRWFIHYYNSRQPEDASTLVLLARGSVRFARWNRNTQIFHFIVNTLCPDALKNDADAWEAHLVSGALLLEKYNREQAIPALQRALAINPRAAEAVVLLGAAWLDQNDIEKAEAKADEALAVNSRLPSALRLKADACFLSGRVGAAVAAAAAALKINPRDQQTLARAAAGYLIEDGLPERAEFEKILTASTEPSPQPSPGVPGEGVAKPSRTDAQTRGDAKFSKDVGRFSKLWADVAAGNPTPGVFLTDLGRLLEARRRLDAAEVCYRRAIAVTPQLPDPKTALGMLLMRVGKTDEAHAILDAAFQADPYHMRVSNFRKVLKLLDGYHVITTEHFVIRVDTKLDKLLGGYMAEYLEEIYPQLVEQFAFAPPQRTQFEIFNKSDGVSAHEWFSARMVGLPWIQTIGASTGVMVAMASPSAAATPFNWARVLRHEFVHVITLQQSRFNVPHWFTEALAVLNEGYPPPQSWNALLVDRVAKGGLRTLETLDLGFQRPADSDDWQFAYGQSRLYAEYMIERGGAGSLRKMLDAYRANATTPRAIAQVFGVDLAAFERGYREFLDRRIAELKSKEPRPTKSVKELEQKFQAQPADASIAGAYAWALLEAGSQNLAAKVAKEALERNPREPWAALVSARLEADESHYAAAIHRLEPLLDRAHPHREILLTLAKLKVLNAQPAEAIALCETGIEHFPDSAEFVQGLAAACALGDDRPRMTKALLRLCALLADDPAPRKKLTQLALKEGRYRDAVRFAKMAMQIDVLDADTHRQLGEACLGANEGPQALAELEAADQLKPKDAEIEILLSKALLAAGNQAGAQARLGGVLERDPKNADARTLLDSLK